MKKLGLMCLVVVIALSCAGIAYANWSQNLTVNTSVSVGSYIVKMQQDPAATALNNGGSAPLTGGIATITIGAVTETGTNAGFSVSIANGYPGLIVKVPYKIAQTGSVPAKVTAMKIGTLGAAPSGSWNGAVQGITLSGGTYTDVKVYNTSDGNTAHISDLLNTVLPANTPLSGATINNVLVIEIPDTLTGLQDAGGLNTGLAETFNFQIDTMQGS
jgi:hypothetical protein